MKWIYALREPDLNKIRYVGQTKNMKTRLAGHNQPDNTSPVARWVRDLKSNGDKPIVILLEQAQHNKADERERAWIRHYRQEGHPLLNMQMGRKGRPNGTNVTALVMPAELRCAIDTEVDHRNSIGVGTSITSFCIEAIEYYLKYVVSQTSKITAIRLNTWRRDEKNALWLLAQQLLSSHALIGERYQVQPYSQLIIERTKEGFDLIDGRDIVGTITVEMEDAQNDETANVDLQEMWAPLATTETEATEGMPEV